MQAGGTVDSFLGTENTMANEGVADLEQSLVLGAVLGQLCQVGSNQLLQLLRLVLTHVAATYWAALYTDPTICMSMLAPQAPRRLVLYGLMNSSPSSHLRR